MATLKPFQATRFEPSMDLARLVCPPYDVISDSMRDALYAADPYNVVRIITGRTESSDDDTHNQYTRARAFFDSWLWEGALQTDITEAIYIYRQTFKDPLDQTREVWGTLGLIDLDDEILAHENTMAGPRSDRRALMEALPVNVSPIYALYAEPPNIGDNLTATLKEFATNEQAIADFTDSDEVVHTIWQCTNAALINQAAHSLKDCPLMIADGHHRFAMSVEFRDAHQEIPLARYVLAFCVDASSQPLCVLPYHRLVHKCDTNAIKQSIESWFHVMPLGPLDPSMARMQAMSLYDNPSPSRMIAFIEGQALELQTKASTDELVPAAVLKKLILEPIGATNAQDHLSFTPDPEHVANEVSEGGAVAGFCLSPIEASTIFALAERGAKMPEKSTYFFPKPRDGIVMRIVQDRSG